MNAVLQTPPVPEIPPLPPVSDLPPWITMSPDVMILSLMILVAGCTIVLWPLMRAIGRRIEAKGVGHGEDPTDIRAELDQLQARVGQVEGVQARLAELEERVDFTERLLAQKREPGRLQGG